MTTLNVCILTAGKGTRMGALGRILNKSLHTIDGKAVISHIINKFPFNTNFVIGIGYLGHQVRSYLSIAHPEHTFEFVDVDNYDGPGSGPGYSLLCCQHHLQKPFYFVSCDTLWDDDLDWNIDRNWFGVAKVDPNESSNYCNMQVNNSSIISLLDKTAANADNFFAFIGLCFIKDYQYFWDGLQNSKEVAGEHQISNGIRSIIDQSTALALNLQWTDVGDSAKYKNAVSRYENYDFSKENEALYIINKQVIKFFADPSISERRVLKARINPNVFPLVQKLDGQFYSYDFQSGETLYKSNNIDTFLRLLDWLGSNLWKPYEADPAVLNAACLKFYKDKTFDRISMYLSKYPGSDVPSVINGHHVASTSDLLSQVPWQLLSDGIPCFTHGDLQFDNILFDKESQTFLLLDWRQDFGGYIEFGDLYYDLAKLYGGIVLNYDYIKLNLLNYSEDSNTIFFDFAQRFQSTEYLTAFESFCSKKGFNIQKIKIIVSLIYLNMSPLHHYPFDKLLYSLGRYILSKELSNYHQSL